MNETNVKMLKNKMVFSKSKLFAPAFAIVSQS